MKNNEKHRAEVWYDDSTQTFHIDFNNVFDMALMDKLLMRSKEYRETGLLRNLSVNYMMTLNTHELCGMELKLGE